MNRIIIIGNGFDLAHGLKTSFYDFIGDYLQSVVRKVGENKCYKDDLIEISLTQYISFSNQETKIINVNIEDRKSLIEFFCKRILGNVNLKVLSYEHEDIEKEDTYKISELFTRILTSLSENKGWVDIEQDYFDVLNDTLKQHHNYKNKDLNGIKNKVIDLNNQMHYLKEKLIEYLLKVQSKENNVEIRLLKQFQQENRRRDYIGRISGKHPSKYYFLNFNYTNTLQKYLFHINDDIQYELNHIHGSLCEKYGSPIFGYADDLNKDFKAFEKEKINELYDNIKTFAYNDEANYANLMRTLNDGDYQVAIYGHSCGLSDRTLLNRIFEHNNCKSIKIFYYQNEEGDDFKDKRYAIYRLFEDKTLLNDRLVNKKDSEPMAQPIT